MGPFASALLLESFLAPFLVTVSLIAIGRSGWISLRSLPGPILASTLMLPASVGVTYVLALGWPETFFLDAKAKVVVATILGAIIGLLVFRERSWSMPALIALAIIIPIWIGLPALQQARSEAGLLILPILIGLAFAAFAKFKDPLITPRRLVVPITLALGIAGITALGRSLSFAELALALASSLIALFLFGRGVITPPSIIAAAAMLSALLASLLLYSEVSKLALLVLGLALSADVISTWAERRGSRFLASALLTSACFFPLSIALLIARFDAGSISIY